MHVVVGSGNPVKRDAVATALATVPATVEAKPVGSGVPDQPWGHQQTVAGATTRAKRAYRLSGATLGVGLEGGVADDLPVPGTYLIMWAAVTDGDRLERGAGPQLRLPPAVAHVLSTGGELGPALAQELDTPNLKEDIGAAGALTDEIIDRSSALRHAVAGALGPFLGAWEPFEDPPQR